jgi:uncharacterized protein YodC (DUF2158 family)
MFQTGTLLISKERGMMIVSDGEMDSDGDYMCIWLSSDTGTGTKFVNPVQLDGDTMTYDDSMNYLECIVEVLNDISKGG